MKRNSSLNRKTCFGCSWPAVGNWNCLLWLMTKKRSRRPILRVSSARACTLHHLVCPYTDVPPLSELFRRSWLPMLTVSKISVRLHRWFCVPVCDLKPVTLHRARKGVCDPLTYQRQMYNNTLNSTLVIEARHRWYIADDQSVSLQRYCLKNVIWYQVRCA